MNSRRRLGPLILTALLLAGCIGIVREPPHVHVHVHEGKGLR